MHRTRCRRRPAPPPRRPRPPRGPPRRCRRRSSPDLVPQADEAGEVVDVAVEVRHRRNDLRCAGELAARLRLALGDHLEVEEALTDLAEDALDLRGVPELAL